MFVEKSVALVEPFVMIGPFQFVVAPNEIKLGARFGDSGRQGVAFGGRLGEFGVSTGDCIPRAAVDCLDHAFQTRRFVFRGVAFAGRLIQLRTRNGVFTLDRFQALIRSVEIAGERFQARTQRIAVVFERFDGRFSITIEAGERVAFASRLIQLCTRNGVFTLDRFQALIRAVQLVGQRLEANAENRGRVQALRQSFFDRDRGR